MLDYYLQAVELDNYSAMNNLACIYLRGEGVKMNLEKSVELFERSTKLGCTIAMSNLAWVYQCCENIEKDLEKSAHYYFRHFVCEKSETSKKKLISILHDHKITWKMDYHPFWNSQDGLDLQILTILCISKSRSSSAFPIVKFVFVKGISINIIKFLCHFRQKSLDDDVLAKDVLEMDHNIAETIQPINDNKKANQKPKNFFFF